MDPPIDMAGKVTYPDGIKYGKWKEFDTETGSAMEDGFIVNFFRKVKSLMIWLGKHMTFKKEKKAGSKDLQQETTVLQELEAGFIEG